MLLYFTFRIFHSKSFWLEAARVHSSYAHVPMTRAQGHLPRTKNTLKHANSEATVSSRILPQGGNSLPGCETWQFGKTWVTGCILCSGRDVWNPKSYGCRQPDS